MSHQPSGSYDVLIIGSGLGGLLCAVLLAKEGMNVCVIEKNRQIGGCLQTFALQKKVFDSSVHYIGGLGEGHTLHRIFRYAGIMDKLQLHALDENGFDRIQFGDEAMLYPQAIGGENFIDQLLPYFPKEKAALKQYLTTMSEVTSRFPLYHLRAGSADEKASVAGLELSQVLQDITTDKRLQQVLAGNNMLYAGVPGKTPFYLHALVLESYLHSAHKVKPGSSDIAKQLACELKQMGGSIVRNTEVVRLVESGGALQYAETRDGQRFYARQFISGIHPAVLLPMIDSHVLRPAFRRRIASLEQTPPALMLNLVLKKEAVAYRNYNLYRHPDGNVFPAQTKDALSTENESLAAHRQWPRTQALFFTQDKDSPRFADTLSVLMYSDYALFGRWQQTHNNLALGKIRDGEYSIFKEEISEKILQDLYEIMPEISGNIIAHALATPLTYRDYTGTPEGSLYGILKNVNQPANTTISTRTKIPNLLLTGQNINLHGVLGVSITALATCAELLGMEYLLGRINAA